MSEIISIQIGHFGNVIGSAFWQDLYIEHNIDINGNIDFSESDPNSFPDVFLYEDQNSKYKPRTLIIDSDPNDFEQSNLFHPNPSIDPSNYIKGFHQTLKNFA